MALFDENESFERGRPQRQRQLEARVAETLALKPSKPGGNFKRAEHGTYNLSPDEEQQAILKYQRQSRQARILQVRAQEMLLAAKNAREFRQRRKRDSMRLLQVLKEAWQEEQARRKAALEADYSNSCKGIGQSHDAAQLLAQNSGALAERKTKEAQVNELWSNLRFQRAMQEENVRKQEVAQEKILARGRRKVLSEAAEIDRRLARNHACQARSEARDEEKFLNEEEGPEKCTKIDLNENEIRFITIQSRLPGAPGDYKDTYFHSRFSELKDRGNRRIVDAEQVDNEAEVDAWEAAEAQIKNVEKEKERKAQLEEIWKRRKAERGQAAAAKLQKIALLEKELAIELEEEGERKHQLRMIEDLTKAVHTPDYKPDTWKLLQPTLFSASKASTVAQKSEVGNAHSLQTSKTIDSLDMMNLQAVRNEKLTAAKALVVEALVGPDVHCEAKIEKGSVEIPEPGDTLCATESNIMHSASKQGRESVLIVLQSSLPVVEAEISPQDLFSKKETGGRIDENKYEAIAAEDTKTKVMEAAGTKEEPTVGGSKSSFHLSQCKVPDLIISGLSSEYKDQDGDSRGLAGSGKLPCCTPRNQSAAGVTKASKDGSSSAKLSSLPNLNRKSGVRKGNKSPRKFEMQVSTAHNDQEAPDYIKVFKARSVVTETDEARSSVNNVGEIVDEMTLFPCVENAAEGCTTEARKESPRKESNSWLSNILEKFPWWKCDSVINEFSCPGVRKSEEKVEGFRRSGEQADPVYGFETVGRVHTPRTKQREESSQEVPATRKSVPFRLETFGSLNTLRDTDWYCAEKPGWSEARTKVVFTKEDLEALKLELYGTLTGETIISQQKKVILGKEKVKPGLRVEPKPEGWNPSLFPYQAKDLTQKAKSVDEEKDQISIIQIKEERSEHPGSPRSKRDKTKLVTRQENKTSKEDKIFLEIKKFRRDLTPAVWPQQECFQKSQSTDETHNLLHGAPNTGERNRNKKQLSKDRATQLDFAEFEKEQTFSKESTEKEEVDVKISHAVSGVSHLQDEADDHAYRRSGNQVNILLNTYVHQRDAFAPSESNHEVKKGKADELISAHEVAEDLIRAWRAGQIGGDMQANLQRAKQSFTHGSRKRRVTCVEDVRAQVNTSYPDTKQKLGQLREKLNRPQENSAIKLRKRDVLKPPHGGVSREKRESSIGNATKTQDTSKCATRVIKVQSPSEVSNQHSKEEFPLLPGKIFSEEAINRRVEDVVPEARSLDFILGSLSAQVRELDERLRTVTACSVGVTDASFTCTPGEHEEEKTIADASQATTCVPLATTCTVGVTDASFNSTPGEHEEHKTISDANLAATYVPLADNVSQIAARSCSGPQSCTGGNSKRVEKFGVLFPDRERINRAKKGHLVGRKCPLTTRKSNGTLSSVQKHQDESKIWNSERTETGLTWSSPLPILQAQSPVSSMGIYLEDMAELMQEMNGSPACEKMRAQLLQDSFLENLPRRREIGTYDAGQVGIEPRYYSEKVSKLETSPVAESQSGREKQGTAPKFSFKKFADRCSGKVEAAISDGSGSSNAENQMPDGMTVTPTHAAIRSPLLQPGRISRSSLDLEETMGLDVNEEHMLLSSSVDFSPWNTANLPDVFTSLTGVGKGSNYVSPRRPTRRSKDGGAKLEHCHLKESSKYILKNNEFKKKCRAFERTRLGRGKSKHKRSARLPFSPLGLPPKRILSPWSMQVTPQPRTIILSRRDRKLKTGSHSKSKLTSRSLPEEFQMSVAAEEVKKWLRREATSCLAGAPDEIQGRKRKTVLKYKESPGLKKPEKLETVLNDQQGRMSPPLVMTTPEVDGKQQLDRRSLIKRDLEARRRPSSAGIVLSKH